MDVRQFLKTIIYYQKTMDNQEHIHMVTLTIACLLYIFTFFKVTIENSTLSAATIRSARSNRNHVIQRINILN